MTEIMDTDRITPLLVAALGSHAADCRRRAKGRGLAGPEFASIRRDYRAEAAECDQVIAALYELMTQHSTGRITFPIQNAMKVLS